MVMDVKEIREYLPHRYPFLLVDRVTTLNLGESIVAYKNVTINEPFFNGHFPDHPVMPGVLVIEAMAQAAGILGFKTMDKTPQDGSIYYFAKENLEFERLGKQFQDKFIACFVTMAARQIGHSSSSAAQPAHVAACWHGRNSTLRSAAQHTVHSIRSRAFSRCCSAAPFSCFTFANTPSCCCC